MRLVNVHVVLQVGCLECGEETSVLGVFTGQAEAEELFIGKGGKLSDDNCFPRFIQLHHVPADVGEEGAK
jgi:hypothetical protein